MLFSENPSQTNTQDADNFKCLCKWALSPGSKVPTYSVMERKDIADPKMRMKPWSMLTGLTMPMLWHNKEYSGTIVVAGDFTRSIVFW